VVSVSAGGSGTFAMLVGLLAIIGVVVLTVFDWCGCVDCVWKEGVGL